MNYININIRHIIKKTTAQVMRYFARDSEKRTSYKCNVRFQLIEI